MNPIYAYLYSLELYMRLTDDVIFCCFFIQLSFITHSNMSNKVCFIKIIRLLIFLASFITNNIFNYIWFPDSKIFSCIL